MYRGLFLINELSLLKSLLFKRELIRMSKRSGVTLDFKPLSRLADKRQYYNFIYFR